MTGLWSRSAHVLVHKSYRPRDMDRDMFLCYRSYEASWTDQACPHPSEPSPLFLRGGKSSYPLARHLKPWNKSRDTRRLELQSTVSGSAILRSHSASPQMEWHTKASLG